MNREKWAKVAMGVCLFGLVVALVGLLPQFADKGTIPWPAFVGASIYLPGAIGLVATQRGAARQAAMTKLRFIRLGFVVVFAVAVYRMMPLM